MGDRPDPMKEVTSKRSAFEEVLLVLPGFQGYLKKEYRRDADRLQRDHLARLLDQARAEVQEAQTTWTDGHRFALLEPGERTQNRLQEVASRIKNADAGYTGFFAADQIGERELEILYEIDRAMLSHVGAVRKACEVLDAAGDDEACEAGLREIDQTVDALEEAFSRRKDAIKGVS